MSRQCTVNAMPMDGQCTELENAWWSMDVQWRANVRAMGGHKRVRVREAHELWPPIMHS